MNNKGFTLIELVGSIVILAVIALIAFPALMSMLNNSNNEVDKATVDVLKSAALEYVNDHIDDDFSAKPITVCDLVNGGYISTTFYCKNKSKIDDLSIDITDKEPKYQLQGGGSDCPSCQSQSESENG